MQRYNLVYRIVREDLDVTTRKCKKKIHFASKKIHWNRCEKVFFLSFISEFFGQKYACREKD